MVQELPKFSGQLKDWLTWKEEMKIVVGHNGWLKMITTHLKPTDPMDVKISSDFYWHLLKSM